MKRIRYFSSLGLCFCNFFFFFFLIWVLCNSIEKVGFFMFCASANGPLRVSLFFYSDLLVVSLKKMNELTWVSFSFRKF